MNVNLSNFLKQRNIFRNLDKYPMQRTRYLEKLNFIFCAFIGLLLPDRALADVANSDSSCLPFPLRNGKNMITQQLHRVVAFLFIDKVEGKNFVNHIDGNKDNNCSDNLEWVTKSENTKHAHENGLIKKTSRKVNQYDKEGNFISQFESIKAASIFLKLDKSTIGHVCAKDKSRSKSCGG